MSEEIVAQLVAALVGALVTILWRLIDRYLPDDSGQHPLPPRPGVDRSASPDTPSSGGGAELDA